MKYFSIPYPLLFLKWLVLYNGLQIFILSWFLRVCLYIFLIEFSLGSLSLLVHLCIEMQQVYFILQVLELVSCYFINLSYMYNIYIIYKQLIPFTQLDLFNLFFVINCCLLSISKILSNSNEIDIFSYT